MSWKSFITDYFSFSKKDRIGLIALLGLIFLAYILPSLFKPGPAEDPQFLEELAGSADTASSFQQNTASHLAEKKTISYLDGELFFFDPNTLDPSGWARLGLPGRNIRTIMNFRNRGGKFFEAEDLQKIWGLPPGFYERIKNHIRIRVAAERSAYPRDKFEKKTSPAMVNINTADSAEFEKLPGIGPRLASRINAFRNKLGGFYSADQVAETYGLPDSTFQKIKPFLEFNGEVKKININTATKEELSQHPYIRWKLAGAITEYKKQHGNFTSLEALKKIYLIDEKTFAKILPYLSL